MDWFWSIFDKIIQNQIWNYIFGHFHFVDWVTVAFILIGLYYGLKEGFFRCVAVTLEAIALLWVVLSFYKKMGGILFENLPFVGDANSRPIAYLILLVLGGILMVFIDGKLKTLFHTKLAGPIRAIGGAVCGVFFLLLIWSMVSQVFVIWPLLKLNKAYTDGGSRTGFYVVRIAPTIYKWMSYPSEALQKSKV